MTTDLVGNVVRSGFCTGCGICESIAAPGKINVALDSNGYLRPTLMEPLDDAERQLFKACCPGVALRHDAPEAGAVVHKLWGPLLSCRTGHANNAAFRHTGSSGGVLSALSLFLIESGKVDFVAQNAVDPTDPLGNSLQCSHNRDDVLRAAGSRYGPAAPLRSLRELLDTGKRFAFIGKPCDVAALRAFGRHDKRVAAQVPYMLSFMCAGVPSRHGTLAVLEHLGVAASDVISFRYRGDGWPGKARAETQHGEVREMDYGTSWGQILNRHLQFRCKICPDGTGEFADVVAADAWYGKDGYPDFEERAGRSLVLGRSHRGESLLSEATASNAVSLEALPISQIALMQPYQVQRKQFVLARLIATLLALGRAPKFWRMGLCRASISAQPIEWLRNAFGTYRRAKREST